jgi:hypothetical protein
MAAGPGAKLYGRVCSVIASGLRFGAAVGRRIAAFAGGVAVLTLRAHRRATKGIVADNAD